jgi:hypothetical protein
MGWATCTGHGPQCAQHCTDSDDEVDQAHGMSHHISLLFANLPQHQQKPSPTLQHASKSSADMHSMSRRRESDLRRRNLLHHFSTSIFHIAVPSHVHIIDSRWVRYTALSKTDILVLNRRPLPLPAPEQNMPSPSLISLPTFYPISTITGTTTTITLNPIPRNW